MGVVVPREPVIMIHGEGEANARSWLQESNAKWRRFSTKGAAGNAPPANNRRRQSEAAVRFRERSQGGGKRAHHRRRNLTVALI